MRVYIIFKVLYNIIIIEWDNILGINLFERK